jgi:arginyl-tRNA synthetase
MPGPLQIVTERLRPAFDRLAPGADPVVRPSDRPGIDLQANGVLAVAKRLGKAPQARDLAAQVIAGSDLAGVCSHVEVAGPGFINLTLADGFVESELAALFDDRRLGIAPSPKPETVVVDYSAPNVAKEMHVGHIRSTFIGDALCRMLAAVDHRVIRENHVGDWGTPFGMLIEHLVDLGEDSGARELSVGELNEFYRQARVAFDASEEFKDRSRERVVALQSGDPETLRLWRVLVDSSLTYFSQIYARIGVLLQPGDVVGESFYDPMLADVVADLDRLGLLVKSDGALCVFPPGFTNRDGEPLPLIVQKSDGGYGYAASDLATIRDRVDRLGATEILYVVGAPQAQHLAMCTAVAKLAGWLPESTRAVHVSFGSMLGSDRRMFKSRSGDTVKLAELVDEALLRAGSAVAEKNPRLPADERAEVARIVGIGAVKYADLATERTKDYVFDWDRMLSFDGNTAPYLQYACIRIRSIFRRAELDPGTLAGESVMIIAPAERELALVLLGFEAALNGALETFSPHKLCTYLYELASTYTSFYEACPVLRAADEASRTSRLVLCDLTARILARGLDLLGIEVPQRM